MSKAGKVQRNKSKRSSSKKRRKNQSFMPPSNLSPFPGRRLSKSPKKLTPGLFGIPTGK